MLRQLLHLAGWLTSLILTLAVVIFAVMNRQNIMLNLSPFAAPVMIPLYLLVLGALAGGFLSGGIFVWLRHIPLYLSSLRKQGSGKTRRES